MDLVFYMLGATSIVFSLVGVIGYITVMKHRRDIFILKDLEGNK